MQPYQRRLRTGQPASIALASAIRIRLTILRTKHPDLFARLVNMARQDLAIGPRDPLINATSPVWFYMERSVRLIEEVRNVLVASVEDEGTDVSIVSPWSSTAE